MMANCKLYSQESENVLGVLYLKGIQWCAIVIQHDLSYDRDQDSHRSSHALRWDWELGLA